MKLYDYDLALNLVRPMKRERGLGSQSWILAQQPASSPESCWHLNLPPDHDPQPDLDHRPVFKICSSKAARYMDNQ